MQNGSSAYQEESIFGQRPDQLAECLVSVRAQVMFWDERYTGWYPFEGGGDSQVTLVQKTPTSIQNGSLVLSGSANHHVFSGRSQQVAPHHPKLQQRASWSPATSTITAQPRLSANGAGRLPAHTLPVNIAAAAVGVASFALQPTAQAKHEYAIFGRRISDQKVLLNCTVVKDVCYRQVMPTFHHWQMGDRKFGLSFKSSYDACKFHNKLQKAIEHLFRQSKSSSGESNLDAEELEDDVFVSVDLPLSRESSETSSNRSAGSGATQLSRLLPLVSEQQPVPSLGRPLHKSSFLKPPAPVPSSVTTGSKGLQQFPRLKSQTAVPLGSSHKSTDRSTLIEEEASIQPAIIELYRPTGSAPGYPYVYFKKEHSPGSPTERDAQKALEKELGGEERVYHYPIFEASTGHPGPKLTRGKLGYAQGIREDSVSGPTSSTALTPRLPTSFSRMEKRESVGSLKIPPYTVQPVLLPIKKGSRGGLFTASGIITRDRCFYCRQWYNTQENFRGSCPEAPEPWEKWIRRVTCYKAAECAVFCCLKEDGELPSDGSTTVCACSEFDEHRCRRWTVLTFLSIFVPCLWCYLPLRACAACCSRCGSTCCGCNGGGKHKPVPVSLVQSSTSERKQSVTVKGGRDRTGSRSV